MDKKPFPLRHFQTSQPLPSKPHTVIPPDKRNANRSDSSARSAPKGQASPSVPPLGFNSKSLPHDSTTTPSQSFSSTRRPHLLIATKEKNSEASSPKSHHPKGMAGAHFRRGQLVPFNRFSHFLVHSEINRNGRLSTFLTIPPFPCFCTYNTHHHHIPTNNRDPTC